MLKFAPQKLIDPPRQFSIRSTNEILLMSLEHELEEKDVNGDSIVTYRLMFPLELHCVERICNEPVVQEY